MWHNFCLVLPLSFVLSYLLGKITIQILKRIKAGQVILGYVSEHKTKGGTPTCGGIFFVLSAVIIYLIFNGIESSVAIVSIAFIVGYMLVGFIDDVIKIKQKRNLGLKAYQKIIFQVSLAIIASFYCYFNGITQLIIPFSSKSIDISWGVFLFIPIVFLATTNCVNLTDGLDGLAGGVCVVYLSIFAIILQLQKGLFAEAYIYSSEYNKMTSLSLCFVGSLLAFLLFNTNKAVVFMGDTGSMALGGLVACLGIFSRNSLIIPILGITFVFSGISVILQVIFFKKTGKRVFLMAPFHHHLQEKGYSECKIAYFYKITTFFCGLFMITFYIW